MAEDSARYERHDVSPRGVAAFAVGLAFGCLIIGAGIWIFERDLNHFFNYRGTATWTSSPAMVPPGPRLQTAPAGDLAEMRAEEDAILHSYGWVDQTNGVVRIPIEAAMQLVVERGLPTRQSPAPSTPKPVP
jgi:hypothetical protein